MTHSDDWDALIGGLREADPRVMAAFAKRYGPLLEGVAARHLAPGLRHRVGPESVVQSACRTFLRRAHEGQFELADPDGLWRLLCAITLTKVREQTRFHLREKRSVNVEVAPPPASDRAVPEVAAPGVPPDEAAMFSEQLERVFGAIGDAEARRIVELRLQELTVAEIARELAISERTVRRIMARVRAHLERTLAAA
ncbi:MAG: sigma-70 family RNA polymerase sigma factor [Deltaproteobacteria bacterium]|nr:MAG: sigma-70 family RNA polymerase sigma factor [Deltaproteobacteria bacterium]